MSESWDTQNKGFLRPYTRKSYKILVRASNIKRELFLLPTLPHPFLSMNFKLAIPETFCHFTRKNDFVFSIFREMLDSINNALFIFSIANFRCFYFFFLSLSLFLLIYNSLDFMLFDCTN